MAPETRYIETYDNQGNLIDKEPYQVSDDELADEVEARAMARADELIDGIDSMATARVFLKRLVKRQIRKGVLP